LPSDKFDVERGEKIAYKRALLQVKKEDIKQFSNELEAIETYIQRLERLKIERNRLKKHLKKAKSQTSNIYKEIENLSNEKTKVVNQEQVEKKSYTGRCYKIVSKKETWSQTTTRQKYILVLDQLSIYRSQVFVFEDVVIVDNSGYKHVYQEKYMDVVSNKKLDEMTEISREEFEKATQENGQTGMNLITEFIHKLF
jgi:Asp-tRNA(Asn)/Glu-tRNA(Gln) amidotransferase C subunit